MTALQTAPVTRVGTVAPTDRPATRYVFALVRIALGTIFAWAFLDKLFGLGHETAKNAAWLNGGNPTKGFLAFGAKGPFTDFYHNIAGTTWANWLFMVGLAGLGLALILGIGLRIAAFTGTILLVMMFAVVLPPANHIFMDDHLIYAGVLIGLALINAGDTLGLGKVWGRIIGHNTWLK
jgi:thiosulfate dehydrogenase [quinone] large subunit